jgi:hypothetical protein
MKEGSQPTGSKPNLNESNPAQPEPPPGLGKRALNIGTPPRSDDVAMQDLSDDGQAADDSLPRKRAATGDGISAGSGSPYRDSSASSASSPPQRSKVRLVSGQYLASDPDTVPRDMLDTLGRPHIGKRQLRSPDQEPPLTKAFFTDPSNLASILLQNSRAQQLQSKSRKPLQAPSQPVSSSRPVLQPSHIQSGQHLSIPENYDIILQPETRPISQEQLVAEVKGIYAGLVMVEAKCIEVDNKQAILAQADPGAQSKLNNEQWQALLTLHQTLLHEHDDFFLASQHSTWPYNPIAYAESCQIHSVHRRHKVAWPNRVFTYSTNALSHIAQFYKHNPILLSMLTVKEVAVTTGISGHFKLCYTPSRKSVWLSVESKWRFHLWQISVKHSQLFADGDNNRYKRNS